MGGGGGGASAPPRYGSSTSPQDPPGQPTTPANGVGVAAGPAGGHDACPAVTTGACPPSPEGRVFGGINQARHTHHGTTNNAGAATPSTALAPAPASSAPTSLIQEMQGRAKIQHTPKALCGVVVTAAGGGSRESPKTTPKGGKASTAAARGSSSAKATSQVVGEEGGRGGAQDGKEATDAVATDGAATGDESDGDGDEDSKHQRQQRALRAFLQGVSE